MKAVLQVVALRDHECHDCFVCFIMSHGNNGFITGLDGQIPRIEKWRSCFRPDKCPGLIGKPKLFFLQACRGSEQQTG
jgi:hypothetical protein